MRHIYRPKSYWNMWNELGDWSSWSGVLPAGWVIFDSAWENRSDWFQKPAWPVLVLIRFREVLMETSLVWVQVAPVHVSPSLELVCSYFGFSSPWANLCKSSLTGLVNRPDRIYLARERLSLSNPVWPVFAWLLRWFFPRHRFRVFWLLLVPRVSSTSFATWSWQVCVGSHVCQFGIEAGFCWRNFYQLPFTPPHVHLPRSI
jgi:hypothetical protein